MLRIICVYGALSGVILELTLAAMMLGGVHGGLLGMVLGYLSMLIALSLVFVGVRQYREVHGGGIIRFVTALQVGLGISAIASLCYVVGWEAYMALTGNAFIGNYVAHALAAKQAAGASAAELAAYRAQLTDFARSYANPLTRMLITLSEIAPVALVVPLISAAVLRNRAVLPAQYPAG